MANLGNTAKLRGVLEKTREILERYFDTEYSEHDAYNVEIRKNLSEIDDALALPPRNCDVGGFNEQQKRFNKWCYQHPECEGCIVGEIKKRRDSCELIWAQMKYEAQEGDD